MIRTGLAARLARPSAASAADVWRTGTARAAQVLTLRGEVPAGALRPGDSVFTRDNGPREIETIREEVAEARTGRAVRIRAGALGRCLPERDVIVAQKTRLLLTRDMNPVLHGGNEAFVRAGDLVGREGIGFCDAPPGGWVAIGLSTHEFVLTDGAWVETEPPRLAGGMAAPAAHRVLTRLEAQLLG